MVDEEMAKRQMEAFRPPDRPIENPFRGRERWRHFQGWVRWFREHLDRVTGRLDALDCAAHNSAYWTQPQ